MSSKKKEETKQVDETQVEDTEKYKVLLKFVNKLLENMEKDTINKLEEFKDVSRIEFVDSYDKHVVTLNEMEDELFKYYDKNKCGFYQKTKLKVWNVVKGMCRSLKTHKVISNKVEERTEDGFRRTVPFYNIIKL